MFGVVYCLNAVDPELDSLAFTANPVAVPLARADGFGTLLFLRSREQPSSTPVFIETSPPAGTEIGLVTGHFVAVGPLR